MPDWLVQEVCEAVSGRLLTGDRNARVSGVSTDSRQVAPGCLFVALTGESFDGHDFCAAAAQGGAAAVVVGRPVAEVGPGTAVIQVDDPLLALGRLAAAHRNTVAPQVTAVTGSVGKSTTKDWIASLLSRSRRTLATSGNFNNEIGLPMTLLELRADTECLVVEMAMRGPGQIAYLCELARPNIGVVTNLGVSHLELLGSTENLAAAKAELPAALPNDGCAVLNADSPHLDLLIDRTTCRRLTFGLDTPADLRASGVQPTTEGGVRFDLTYEDQVREVRLPVPGRHSVANALAVAGACLAQGLSLEEISEGLAAVPSASMRLERRESPRGCVVLSDCYNAAPDSMRAAIEVARDSAVTGRRLAVLGDMKELGPESERFHHEVGALLAAAGFASLCAIGEFASALAAGGREGGLAPTAVCEFSTPEAALPAVVEAAAPGDLVLVKGSRALRLERIVEALCAA